MSRPPNPLLQGLRHCGSWILAFVVWSVWLALALVLALQIYVASTHELEVPGFVLRRLEQRLAEAGLRATFGRTSFDPTGRVLVEDARLFLPAADEPIVTARSVFVRLDPWFLTIRRIEPVELRVSGVSWSMPAMLSGSGRAEELVRDIDATLLLSHGEITVTQLSARMANLTLSARGALYRPRAGGLGGATFPELLAKNFLPLCRQAADVARQLALLDEPALHLELAPSESHLATATLDLFARGLRLDAPFSCSATGLHISTRLPLTGDEAMTSRVAVAADRLSLPFAAEARGVRAILRGRLQSGAFNYEPRSLELEIDSLAAAGYSTRALSAHLLPGPLPRLIAEISARFMGEPLALRADADFSTKSATVGFVGAISPAILGPLSEQIGVEVRKYFDFAALDCENGVAFLGPDWKFSKLSAQVRVQGINAYHVIMEEGRATVELAGHLVHAPEAYARIGENFARGSFDQDLQTRDYRFLLQGRLRPLAISEWFREWWPDFFKQLEFPAAPPEASVDVTGRWTDGDRSHVFVFAEAPRAVVRGAAFDYLRTRLFIRPAFFDGLEIFARHGDATAGGTFTYATNPDTHAWRTLDLDLASTLDLKVATQLLGDVGAKLLAPFTLSAPPALKLRGRLDGPDAPQGEHQRLAIEAVTTGPFRLYDFPLENVSFAATLNDDDLTLERTEARFAGGTASGRAKIWGAGAQRRIGFDYQLNDASLGLAVAALQEYSARKNGRPPEPPGKFVREKAGVTLGLAVSAEGRYDDPYSYRGEGNATLKGAELGEVALLGALSELFKFTALRFTSAQGNFKVAGPKLVFSELTLRGANSAIDGHGTFSLDQHELDFKAKIFPFHESGGLIKSVVGAVLSPLSNVFEVKLTGNLEKPDWAFVIGPTNLFRSLAPGSPEAPAAEAKPEPKPATAP